MSSSVGTNATEQCPRCKVLRGPLPSGGWCSTCGFNPTYETERNSTRVAIEAAKQLYAEVRGMDTFELAMREAIGNSGWSCLYKRHKTLGEALDALGEAHDEG